MTEREQQRDFVDVVRESLLRGNVKNIPMVRKFSPKRQLRIFVSSTFTDTYIERNILHESILPQLQKEFKEHSIQIIFSDLRFGIKDQNTVDHLTWISCAKELVNCYESSDGLFFLSLQSEKYGYLPLPKYIPKKIFEDTLLTLANDQYLTDLTSQWYQEDTNQGPSSHYELKKLKSLQDNDFWRVILPALREKVFSGLPFDSLHHQGEVTSDTDTNVVASRIDTNQQLLINRSVTEWETKLALFLDPKRCFWIYRPLNISITVSQNQEDIQKQYSYLCDTIGNESIQRKCDEVKEKMKSTLSPENIYQFSDPLELKSYNETKNSSCYGFTKF
jgi:hypothetical protein